MSKTYSNGFTVFKDLGKLRVCTGTRIECGEFNAIPATQKVAIEYQCNEDCYIVIAYVTPKTKTKGEIVANRYKEYIVKNHLEDLYFEALIAAKFAINPRYIQTPEETQKSIQLYFEKL